MLCIKLVNKVLGVVVSIFLIVVIGIVFSDCLIVIICVVVSACLSVVISVVVSKIKEDFGSSLGKL